MIFKKSLEAETVYLRLYSGKLPLEMEAEAELEAAKRIHHLRHSYGDRNRNTKTEEETGIRRQTETKLGNQKQK